MHRVELLSFAFASRALLALVTTLVACGCGARHPETTAQEDSALLGQDGSDTSDVEAQTSSLTATFALAPLATTAPSADDAFASADGVPAYFAPAGCATVTKDSVNRRVTYVFDACSGPWGLVHVSGTVIASYTSVTTPAGGAAVHIDAVGTALRLKRAVVDYHASATLSTSGVSREMTWSGELSGVTARGRPFRRSAQWDVRWRIGEACVAIDGSATGDVKGRTFFTTVRHYQRCRGACPQAGGDVTITDAATGRAVDIQYDGTDVADAISNGVSSPIVLACGL